MRVGIYAGDYLPETGGSSSLKSIILQELANQSRDHEFLLFHGRESIRDRDLPLPGIFVNERREARQLALARGIHRLYPRVFTGAEPPPLSPLDRHARERQVDLLWFFAPFYQPTRLPFFYTLYDLEHRTQPWFPEVSVTGWDWEARERHFAAVLPRATKVFVGTEVGKAEVSRYFGVCPDNVAVLPFPTRPVSPAGERDTEVLDRYRLDPPYLLYPAQFWPHKNHVTILLALVLLEEVGKIPFTTVFVGSDKGNLDYVRAKARELGLEERVRFLGFVPEAELVALYRNAFALVFASFFGPDNLPPLEAFHLGCPVVASRVSGAEEQLRDAALLFDPGNPVELAEALDRLSGETGLREELIRRGKARPALSAAEYAGEVVRHIDAFASIRRCWGHDYRQR